MEKLLKELDAIEKNGKGQCVPILQKMGEKLLTEYYIQVGDLKIEPLRVEAYYFHEKNFEDNTVYKKEEQKEYDRLFLHGPNVGYEGVDICIGSGLSGDSNRHLAFLIKDSIVTEKNRNITYYKQIALYKRLKKIPTIAKLEKSILRKKEKSHSLILHTARTGVSDKPFGKEMLGSLLFMPETHLKNNEGKDITIKGISYCYFAKGFARQWTLAKYALEKARLDIEKAQEIIKKEGLSSSKIEDKYMKSALEYIKSEGK